MGVPRRRPTEAELRRGAASFESELAAWQETERLRRAAEAFERELAAWEAERRQLRERAAELDRRERELDRRERELDRRERELEEEPSGEEPSDYGEPDYYEAPDQPLPPDEPAPRTVDEDELEELYEDVAEQWDIPVDLAEELVSGLVVGTHESLEDRIEELADLLDELGYDIDVSDLWDLYYGYGPAGES